MGIAERLKEARKRAGLSQEEVARRADIGVFSVSRLERGEVTDPHISTLENLAHALGVSVLYLYAGEEGEAPKAAAPQGSGHDEEERAKFGSWAQFLTLQNEHWIPFLNELPEPPNPQEFDCGKRLIRVLFDTTGAFITGLKNYGVLEDVQRLVEAEHEGLPVPDAFADEVYLLHGELGVLINRVIPKARNWYTRFEERAEMRDQLENVSREWERDLGLVSREA